MVRETFTDRWLSASCGLTNREGREMEPDSRISDNIDIDHKTSRSICDEVG